MSKTVNLEQRELESAPRGAYITKPAPITDDPDRFHDEGQNWLRKGWLNLLDLTINFVERIMIFLLQKEKCKYAD